MSSNWWRVIITVFLATSVLTSGVTFAEPNDLAKKADKIIRNAERNMHNGKNEEAATMLQEAALLLEQGKAEEPTNSKIAQTEKKLNRIQIGVDKKLGKTAAKKTSSRPAMPKKPQPKAMSSSSSKPATAAQQSDSAELPSNVKSSLAKINIYLNNAESGLARGKSAKSVNHQIVKAAEIFELIDKRYAGKFNPTHPDFVAVKDHYNELVSKVDVLGNSEAKAKADTATAKDAREKQSAEWIPKFQEYLAYSGSEGHNPAKLVFVPGTSEPEKFADAKKRYEAFKKFYEEYKKTDFPNGKTWKLEDLADNAGPTCLTIKG